MDKTELKKILNDVKNNVSKLVKGKDDILEKAICTFFSGGHLLLEDVPGTGKTTLAKALAKSVDMNFNRIQFTPDLMPADITGVSIFNQNKGVFEFRKGPVFSNIVLADEINRASPRTQSALLEAMGEGQVSTDSGQFILEKPFFVIATQNNVESKGTYTLPESQMDRFTMKLSLGYVSINEEIQILDGLGFIRQLDELKPVVDSKKVVEAMETIERIKVSDELKHFIVTVVNHTRNAQGVKLGASPRASLNLMKVAQAAAAFDGRDFVIPDDILSNAVNVLAHRLILDSSGYITGISRENAIISILEKIKVPG
ncbi:MAG TPA: MoxR family ATPase [bacterium]|nr:MoxR family ATPase [bacterium]HPM47025.1 MoxR family ATPase [bacterium]HPY15601.1 MoxR family ATPase [bacterium]HQI05506.1 MoxR family ATPase [bacterium]HRQ70686.1 MoxR family ATPase [bacterium]